ncbi:non-ribosomal peptide synthetase [Streptomyces sp. JV184]|uniref:non-ribosomal peptide synthetase n=1 Tax=Streptomyces sp. JV184 TaxID=858637 RepID=UPI002E76AACB|nr:non-ribosomal peptide synthetase [Streptomyces sp. JV184]MEE1744065.1 non-ribosomal peptide synthetase [Streptomyces sp. JV184]
MTALTELLRTSADRYPDKIAVVDDHHELTYTELSAAVAHTAARLRDADPDGGPVLLALAPGTAWVTALLGAWHSGRPAVPLDVTHPSARLRQIAAGCRATAILTSTGTPPGWTDGLTALTPATSPEPSGTAPSEMCTDEETAACIWHTSGSTGAPKPVLVSHRAVAARAAVLPSWFGLTHTDRVAQLTALTFDAVLWEVLGALTAGARLEIASIHDRAPGPALPRFLSEREITAFTGTPTYLAAAPFTELPRLRRIVLGGEALHPGPLKQWIGRYDVANAYGPTEACVEAIVTEHVRPGEDPVPIGRPLPGVRAWILDGHQQPVPAGQAGELYLGGQGLATGYLGRPRETARAFLLLRLPGSDSERRLERVYRTGDRVRQRPDGQYVFLGRVDNQLNLGGVRLEPTEVERAATQLPGVRAAVLLTDRGASGRSRLVLHVEADDTDLPVRLRRQLADRLPPSAVPARIIARPALPRISSGKIDRRALATTPEPKPPEEDTAAEPGLPEDVAGWWHKQTGAPADGARDFFAVGGDSLGALLLLQQINEKYGTEITLDAFYADPTTRFLTTALTPGSTP